MGIDRLCLANAARSFSSLTAVSSLETARIDDAVVVLEFLVDLFQQRQSLEAPPAPGRPQVDHHDLARERLAADRLALEIGEREIVRQLRQEVGRGRRARHDESLHQLGRRGDFHLKRQRADLVVGASALEIDPQAR